MKILITGQAGEEVFRFENAGPWKLFKREILSQGHEICENGFSERADVVIANSFSKKLLNYMNRMNIPLRLRTLVAWEPYVVDCKNYKQRNLREFGFIYAPSVVWAKEMNAIPFKWPQDAITQEDSSQNWTQRDSKVVVIQGNKFSAVRGEMYSTRRRAIKAFNDDDLRLYGTNWNKGLAYDFHKWLRSALDSPLNDFSLYSLNGIGSKYVNYEGPVNSKIDVLKKYKVSLVIENSLDFVSEKLFDAVRAGCIVVYVGPDLDLFELPKNAVIQVSPNIEEIKEICHHLLALPDADQELLSLQQISALSKVSEYWENTRVLPKLASEIIKTFSGKAK